MQTAKKIFTPDPPPPPPPQSGCWDWTGPPVGKFFSKTPHMCVQNDQRDEGIILKYVCSGTPQYPPPKDPPPTHPTPMGPKKFEGGCDQDLSVNIPPKPFR